MARFAPPSDLELQVLAVFWQRGPLTVRQMLAAMPDGKKRAYTSILSVMQVMERKGLLKHRIEGKAHVYEPAISRSRVLGPLLRRLVSHVFGGSSAAAVQQLLKETDVRQGDVEEIRHMLSELSNGSNAPARRRGHGAGGTAPLLTGKNPKDMP